MADNFIPAKQGDLFLLISFLPRSGGEILYSHSKSKRTKELFQRLKAARYPFKTVPAYLLREEKI